MSSKLFGVQLRGLRDGGDIRADGDGDEFLGDLRVGGIDHAHLAVFAPKACMWKTPAFAHDIRKHAVASFDADRRHGALEDLSVGVFHEIVPGDEFTSQRLSANEGEKVGIDNFSVHGQHAVRQARINFPGRIGHKFGLK